MWPDTHKGCPYMLVQWTIGGSREDIQAGHPQGMSLHVGRVNMILY